MNISKRLLKGLDIVVLICSIALVVVLSYESLSTDKPFTYEQYIDFQLFICVVYLLDFFVRLFAESVDKRCLFFKRNFFFLLVSIPYLSIIDTNISAIYFFLKIIPLFRGAYGFAIIISWFTKSKISNLFYSYILMVSAFTYISALAFYATEKDINENVENFWNAICWAGMNVTTVGAPFFAKYALGQTLAIILPGLGMILFPIFTVYVTNKFQKINK